MGEQPTHVEVTGYVTIEPEYRKGTGYYAHDDQGRPVLTGARITGITKNRPARSTRSGTIVTQVRFKIEAAALLPLLPQAEILIRAGDAETIEVVAMDPDYPPTEETE